MAKKKNTTAGQQLNMFAGVNTTAALNAQIADIEKKITALYGSTYKFAAQIAQVRTAVAAGQEFTFADNQAAAKQIEQRLTAIATTLDQQLGKATERSFALGQASTTNALTKALGTDKATKEEVQSITEDAAAAMRKRGADGHTYYTQQHGGVSISDRVWNITESTKLEIEIAIQQAALEGKSPDDLAHTIQQYLNHPERLFRSVRVKDPTTGEWTGEYRMSKAAKNCHPGQGVYRSAYKNALRLARTELTQAYRRAEWETYQDNPLITGYRIELSNNHTTTITTRHGKQIKPLHDICDEMQGTQYPKTFLWTGWHPQCRCRMIPITISKDDFKERVKARHRGKLDEWQPKEQTTEMPKAFTDWVEANKHRWQQKGHVAPFFIRDNYQQGDVAKGLDSRITADLEAARLAAQQAAARTEEERRKAEEAAKAAATPQPITDYDDEIMELRSVAAKFDLDLGNIEAIRAAGKPQEKSALKREITKQQNKKRKIESDWQKAYDAAYAQVQGLMMLLVTYQSQQHTRDYFDLKDTIIPNYSSIVFDHEPPTGGHGAPVKDCIKTLKHFTKKMEKLWYKFEGIFKTAKTSPLDGVLNALSKNKIEYRDCEKQSSEVEREDDEIINRLGGGDKTKGSCSSLAFAFAGNKAGYRVLDFRDGESRKFFASTYNIVEIAKAVGGQVESNPSDYTNANLLLNGVQEGRYYYFTCGAHAAIVRKEGGTLQYLELQSATSNGFKLLTNDVLKTRFGAKKRHSYHGFRFNCEDVIIEISLLGNDDGFIKMLGYINTEEHNQVKGAAGTTK